MSLKISKNSLLGFLFCSCFFYTSQIMLSPVYFGFSIVIVILIFNFFIVDELVVDLNFIFGSLGLLYALLIFYKVTDFGTYVNFIMCMFLLITYSVLFKNTIFINKRVVLFFTFLLLSLYFFESFYRISNPIITEKMLSNPDESLLFYKYKFNSIMFIDSNFVALSLISFIVTVDILFEKSKMKTYLFSMLFILLVLTFSRAALISVVLYFFLKHTNLNTKFIFSIIIGLTLLYIIPIIVNDGSYLSKIKILNVFYQYLLRIDTFTFLFGSGVGTSADVLGIGSHNLFVLLVVEFGFISLLGFFSFVIFNIYHTSCKSFPYWCSIFVCGFSLGSIYVFIFLPALLLTSKYRSVCNEE
ncbi:hypothetical protein Q4Q54_19615 [Shewanella sp. SP2S2-4]|uniref:hypothetical protein n=1 Tax=Shewanella sp. SP2S2-4 TaxID=3063539 RepID=UPI0028917D62|nr:hypothetical protein [Shewanella sp. SP2S2-4]MDT3275663.1 hypothetical protein [Shewanella sp. SP2S2-4]